MKVPDLAYLVGVDGSEQSHAALRWALGLAATTGARVEAVAAWSIPPEIVAPVYVGASYVPMESLQAAAEDRLSTAVAGVDEPDQVRQVVVQGIAGPVLAKQSARFDLVVVGRTGQGRLSRMVSGSTARYLAAHAHCPVALVGDQSVAVDSIVVGIDGSAHSLGALRWATALSDTALSDTVPVTLVHAHDHGVLERVPLPPAVRAVLDARPETLLHDAIESGGYDPDSLLTEVVAGDARSTIVDRIEPHQLLVLGAAGHNQVAAAVFGSVAGYAIDHCAGPVVIWR